MRDDLERASRTSARDCDLDFDGGQLVGRGRGGVRQELEAGEVRASKRLPLRLCSRPGTAAAPTILLPVGIVMMDGAAAEKETADYWSHHIGRC